MNLRHVQSKNRKYMRALSLVGYDRISSNGVTNAVALLSSDSLERSHVLKKLECIGTDLITVMQLLDGNKV